MEPTPQSFSPKSLFLSPTSPDDAVDASPSAPAAVNRPAPSYEGLFSETS